MSDKKIIFKITVLLLVVNSAIQARTTCKDFATQAEAQAYYDARYLNWKRLDGDKDGEPCECLSGGSASHKSFCKKWREKHGKK
jgi:hypothetical protein